MSTEFNHLSDSELLKVADNHCMIDPLTIELAERLRKATEKKPTPGQGLNALLMPRKLRSTFK
jgi:hypothetical protein